MKILITALSEGLDSPIDMRFGRGANYCVVDTDTLVCESHANPALNASGGAGIQAAQFAGELGVDAVISGHFGPKAADVLNAAGIRMVLLGESKTVREAMDRFKAGQLQYFDPAQEQG